jgi:hypothetical protein
MPPPRPIHAKKDICIINNDDDFLLIPHFKKCEQLGVTKLSIFKNNSCVQHAPRRRRKPLPKLKLPHHSLVPNHCKLVYYKSIVKFDIFEQSWSGDKGNGHYIDIHNRGCLWIASSSKRNVNKWVVCIVVENRHNFGQDTYARSQSLHGNFYE